MKEKNKETKQKKRKMTKHQTKQTKNKSNQNTYFLLERTVFVQVTPYNCLSTYLLSFLFCILAITGSYQFFYSNFSKISHFLCIYIAIILTGLVLVGHWQETQPVVSTCIDCHYAHSFGKIEAPNVTFMSIFYSQKTLLIAANVQFVCE